MPFFVPLNGYKPTHVMKQPMKLYVNLFNLVCAQHSRTGSNLHFI